MNRDVKPYTEYWGKEYDVKPYTEYWGKEYESTFCSYSLARVLLQELCYTGKVQNSWKYGKMFFKK